MKKKSIFILSTFILTMPILILTGVASASSQASCMLHDKMSGHNPDAMMGSPLGDQMRRTLRMMEKLDLSKNQRKKVWSIMDKARPQKRTLMLSLYEGRKQLKEVTSNGAEQNKVRKLAKDYGETTTKLILLRSETRGLIHSILTAEQRNKFKKMRGRKFVSFQQNESNKLMSLETAVLLHRLYKNI